MEKSVKNYSGRERIIPALLLVIGLICASWISTHTSKTELSSINPDRLIVASDTIKKNKKTKNNKKTESKSKETSANKQERNHQSELEPDLSNAEEFETDYAFQFNQGHFPVPDNDFELHGMPPMSLMMPPFPDVLLQLDSPGIGFQANDWAEFSKEFEENFKAKFGDFYEKHQVDIKHMLDDVHEKVNNKFDKEWEIKIEDFGQNRAAWAKAVGERWQREAELLSQQDEHMQREQESFQAQQGEFERNRMEFELRMGALKEGTRLWEEKMKEQLIKDGYLGKDEKLESMYWHNGKLEINGKKIKPEDQKKYDEIHDKYFGLEKC